MCLFKYRDLILQIKKTLGENNTYLVQSVKPEDDNMSVETCSSLL